MSWRRPFQATISGAAITLGSAVISCGLAIQVEASAHRLLFWCAPYKYANVEYAYGLDQSQLDSVRHLARPKRLETPATPVPIDDHEDTLYELNKQHAHAINLKENAVASTRPRRELLLAAAADETTRTNNEQQPPPQPLWLHQRPTAQDVATTGIPLPSSEALMRQDIVACSMTS